MEMKVVLDMTLLVADEEAIDLFMSPSASSGSTTSSSAHSSFFNSNLYFSHCLSHSPWREDSKLLYDLLISVTPSLQSIFFYSKCPPNFLNWMTLERRSWSLRELGHTSHPLLTFCSKKDLRQHMTSDTWLLTHNENLCKYWRKYSKKCIHLNWEVMNMKSFCLHVEEKLSYDISRALTHRSAIRTSVVDDLTAGVSTEIENDEGIELNMKINMKECTEKRSNEMKTELSKNEINKENFALTSRSGIKNKHKEAKGSTKITELEKNIKEDSIKRENLQISSKETIREENEVKIEPVEADAIALSSLLEEGMPLFNAIRNVLVLVFAWTHPNLDGTSFLLVTSREVLMDSNETSWSSWKCEWGEMLGQLGIEVKSVSLSSNDDDESFVEVTYNYAAMLDLVRSCEECLLVSLHQFLIALLSSNSTGLSDEWEVMTAQLLSCQPEQLREIVESVLKQMESPNKPQNNHCHCCHFRRQCSNDTSGVSGKVLSLLFEHLLEVLATEYCLGTSPKHVLIFTTVPSPSCEEKSVMTTVFTSVKHVCAYLWSRKWREATESAVTLCIQQHRLFLHSQWQNFCSDDSEEEDLSSKKDVIGKPLGMSTLKGPMVSYCSSENMQAVIGLLKQVITAERSARGDDASDVTAPSHLSNPFSCTFSSIISKMFTSADYCDVPGEFYEAGLWHLLPLWPLCSGAFAIVDLLHRRSKWLKQKSPNDITWRNDSYLALSIVEDLLFWKPVESTEEQKWNDIHKKLLMSLRYTTWRKRLELRSMLYGVHAPSFRCLVRRALDECGTDDNGFSAAKIHALEKMIEKHKYFEVQNKRKKKMTKRRKAKSGMDVFLSDYESSEEGANQEDETPPRTIKRHKSTESPDRVKYRNFSGRKTGRDKGRLMYRHATVQEGRRCVGGEESMKVEFFALCRYFSIMSKDLAILSGQQSRRTCFSVSSASHSLKSSHDAQVEAVSLSSSVASSDISSHLFAKFDSPFLATEKGPGPWAHGCLQVPSSASGGEELWLGSYCEGSIWLTLLLVLMHEEIFDESVPYGVMQSRSFMTRPLDFLPETHADQPWASPVDCSNFFTRRRVAIEKKLAYLKCLSAEAVAYETLKRMKSVWGTRFYGVNWERADDLFVTSVAWSLGGWRLAIVLEEMLRDPVCYCRGMPDLLFCRALPEVREFDVRTCGSKPVVKCHCCPWNLSTGVKCFVSEVKSTNDRLSEWQAAWFDLFEKADIPFEEAHVNWKH